MNSAIKSLSFIKAKTLLADPYSCLKLLNTDKHIVLHPKYLTSMKRGIILQLNYDMNKYSSRLNGVPVAYSNVKLQNGYGTIDEKGFCHLKVLFEVIVFQPVIGSNVKGIVNKKSKEHIGCVIHGCFNAAIIKRFNDHIVSNIGDEVTMKVLSMYPHGAVLSISADFLPSTNDPKINVGKSPLVKSSSDFNNASDATHLVDSSVLPDIYHRKRNANPNLNLHAVNSSVDLSVSNLSGADKHKKKKKHKKNKSTEMTNPTINDSQDRTTAVFLSPDISEHKKKKKSKKHDATMNDKIAPLSSSDSAFVDDSYEYKRAKKKKKRRHSEIDDTKITSVSDVSLNLGHDEVHVRKKRKKV